MKFFLTVAEMRKAANLMKVFAITILFLFFIAGQSSAKGNPQNIITGKVIADSAGALSGVSITIKGTTKGTTTDAAGNFSIEAASTDVLVFSYVGYDSQEIAVGSQTQLDVRLMASKKELDQVVVIGYGSQRKRDLTGSIAVVSGDAIAKQPNTNPIASLQGMVAGLTVVNSTGQAGASPTVRIRGVSSTNNVDPLYVVDGIFEKNIDFLNPADIENIEILKDPSSLSIFGLQGGNGVIIVTTKRAKKGQTLINFAANVGIQTVQDKVKVTDAAGFEKLYSQQLANLGAPAFDFSHYTGNTDWQDQIYRSAVISNNSLSISNNTDKTSTLLNIGYSNQQGVLKYDNYQKYIARLNEEIKITNNITVGGDVTGYYYKQNPPPTGVENEALWVVPIIPVQAGPGLYYHAPSFQRAQTQNPVAAIEENNGHTINDGYRLAGSLYGQIKFLKNFTIRSAVYADLGWDDSRVYTPLPYHYINIAETNAQGLPIPTDTSYDATAHTGISQAKTTTKEFQQDHTLTFDKIFSGGHHLTVLAGFSTIYQYSENVQGNRQDTSLNIPDDPRFWYLNVVQQSNPGTYTGSANDAAKTSFLGRVNYTFQNRYLVNLSFRRDGSSKFSPSNHWGNFGSAGLGWVATDESFLKNISWLNFLKVKASYGTVGLDNQTAENYYIPSLNTTGVGVFGNNVYSSVQPAYIPDPNLHFETSRGEDVGFESRLFKNRLSLDVDFYDKKTKGLLTMVTVPNLNLPYFTNLGDVDNKGVEVTANWSDRAGKDFSYSIGGNFSYNKNEVTSIGNNFDFQIFPNGVNLTQTGNSVGYFYGYVQTGIYQTTAQLDKTPHLATALPGDIVYADINGDGKIDGNDRTYLGTPFPKISFGGNISLRYKSFDLGVQLQGVSGNKIYIQRATYTFAPLNYEVNRLNAWTGAGTSNIEPILDNSRSDNYLFSNYWLQSGSYLRLRTVQLGYTFNTAKRQNSVFKALRLYISGQNIATFSHATGYSPEVPINNPTEAGIDNGIYPVPAVYSFGLSATF